MRSRGGRQTKITRSGSAAIVLLAFACFFLLTSCDPVTRHKVLTTVLDGVPSLPEPAKLCEEYHEMKLAEAEEAARAAAAGGEPGKKGSTHRPYVEKKCNDCHDFQKEVGLILPKRSLCVHCHQGFVKGRFVHGPVAVGDCSACHMPHSSQHSALLEMDKSAICSKCHREKRLAESMHDKVMARGMACVDCHDPHYGGSPYFLR